MFNKPRFKKADYGKNSTRNPNKYSPYQINEASLYINFFDIQRTVHRDIFL